MMRHAQERTFGQLYKSFWDGDRALAFALGTSISEENKEFVAAPPGLEMKSLAEFVWHKLPQKENSPRHSHHEVAGR